MNDTEQPVISEAFLHDLRMLSEKHFGNETYGKYLDFSHELQAVIKKHLAQPAHPVPTPVDGGPSPDKTFGKLLGEIVGVAIVEQLKERRWFINWRTLDEREKWTADDFYQLEYPEDFGTIGGMCVDIVSAIKPKVEALIEKQSAAHLQAAVQAARKEEAEKLDTWLMFNAKSEVVLASEIKDFSDERLQHLKKEASK